MNHTTTILPTAKIENGDFIMNCEIASREICELEVTINKLIFDLEDKYRETGVLITPILCSHTPYDNNKGGRIQFLASFQQSNTEVWKTKTGKRM